MSSDDLKTSDEILDELFSSLDSSLPAVRRLSKSELYVYCCALEPHINNKFFFFVDDP